MAFQDPNQDCIEKLVLPFLNQLVFSICHLQEIKAIIIFCQMCKTALVQFLAVSSKNVLPAR